MEMTQKRIIKDSIQAVDTIASSSLGEFDEHKGWRSSIVGKDEFGRTLFEAENRLVIGGAFYLLEKLFGVRAPFTVEYLNDIMGIAQGGDAITDIYPKDNTVCLFGLGTGGADESISNIYPVSVKEREIFEPVPFRYTDALTSEEEDKYFFMLNDPATGKTAYYLKRFESTPKIHALWVDSPEEGEDGTPVQAGVHSASRTTDVETFVEMPLHITKKDLREWFEAKGEIEKTRFNSIAIFSGIQADCGGYLDYKQVKMVAKFNIPNEMLTMPKSMTMFYRVYAT